MNNHLSFEEFESCPEETLLSPDLNNIDIVGDQYRPLFQASRRLLVYVEQRDQMPPGIY